MRAKIYFVKAETEPQKIAWDFQRLLAKVYYYIHTHVGGTTTQRQLEIFVTKLRWNN